MAAKHFPGLKPRLSQSQTQALLAPPTHRNSGQTLQFTPGIKLRYTSLICSLSIRSHFHVPCSPLASFPDCPCSLIPMRANLGLIPILGGRMRGNGTVTSIPPPLLQTPLMLAANSGHLECVKLLLCCSADITARNGQRQTAISLAEKSGHVNIAKYLQGCIGEPGRGMTLFNGHYIILLATSGRLEAWLCFSSPEAVLSNYMYFLFPHR